MLVKGNDKMRIEKELCQKFPTVLKDKLLKNEIEFPETTKFEYEDLYTYRAVERNWDDNRPVSLEDFKSYFELGKKPKRPRGVGWGYYEGSTLLWCFQFPG